MVELEGMTYAGWWQSWRSVGHHGHFVDFARFLGVFDKNILQGGNLRKTIGASQEVSKSNQIERPERRR